MLVVVAAGASVVAPVAAASVLVVVVVSGVAAVVAPVSVAIVVVKDVKEGTPQAAIEATQAELAKESAKFFKVIMYDSSPS